MTIGLFAPLPLAMMIPFMAGQSLMMGEAFGKGFQYGKRKISSMSNEEFNALTPSDLGKSITTDYNAIIPHLGQAVQKSSEFQSLVIKEIIDVIKKLPGDIVQGFTQTQTSASLYGEGGSVVSPVRQGGRTPVFNEDAIQNTVQGIEDAAKAYMEFTGLADFEKAKEKIRQIIKAKNAPAPFVRKPVPTVKYVPLAQRQQVSKSNPDPAYGIEINSNIANYRALIKDNEAKLAVLNKAYPTSTKKLALGKAIAFYIREIRKYKSLLADWIKKGQNYQILLKNR